MWVFSRDGYFSAIRDDSCGPDELMVRGRCRADLERLRDKIPTKNEIVSPGDDYLFRLVVNRDEWGEYLKAESTAIDYPCFRDTVQDGDNARAFAYFMVWGNMRQWQQKEAIRSGDWKHFPVFDPEEI